MSAQPVDVLAVLDRAMAREVLEMRAPMAEARAAVAELIAAVADVYVETDVVCAVSCPSCRIRAALARCGGQP